MTLPVSVRINAPITFPAQVIGGAGVSIAKSNGIFTVSLNFGALAPIGTTAIPDPGAKTLAIFDPVTGVYNSMSLAGLGDALFKLTSTTSLTIGTGSFTFVTQPNKEVGTGSWVIATSNANVANFMIGQVTAYDSLGNLTISVPAGGVGGAGTKADWTIRPTSPLLTGALGSIDVFAIGGQSNAQGQGGDATLSPIVPAGKVFQYSAGVMSAGNDPVGNAAPSSAWPAFGSALYGATGRPVLLVPSAVGGTNQSALITIGSTHWDIGGTLAPALVTNVNAAMAAARAAGYTPTFRGILWLQGENDAGAIGTSTTWPTNGATTATGGPYAAGATSITVASATGIVINETLVITLDNGTTYPSNISNVVGTTVTLSTAVPVGRSILTGANLHVYTKSDYRAALMAMLNYFRTTAIDGTTFPQLPVYISTAGQVVGGTNADLGYLKVRTAQEEVAAADNYTRIVYRGAQDFTVRNMMQSGGGVLHYLQEGYNEVGREMAKGVVSNQAGDTWMQRNYNVYRVALGGAVRNGDLLDIVITHPALVGTPLHLTGNIGGAQTLTQFATQMVNTINTFVPAFNDDNIRMFATSAGPVITIYQPASLTPQATVTASWPTGGATETATVTSGTSAFGSVPGVERWPQYTAKLTPNVGTITQGGSSSFLQVGKLVYASITPTVAAIAGGPASVTLTLPVAPLRDLFFIGCEGGNTGKVIRAGFVAGSTTSTPIKDHLNVTWVPALNDEYAFSGSYEAA